jgi:hypothetical protein
LEQQRARRQVGRLGGGIGVELLGASVLAESDQLLTLVQKGGCGLRLVQTTRLRLRLSMDAAGWLGAFAWRGRCDQCHHKQQRQRVCSHL